ncbi:hybrid sensor histidine kinase/response regulator transcription factor [Pedobacter africanus]|uniref:histidine kinase n=1 Tax=Pedobacter africanus TaxID=151894 RepID=A0A1W2B3Y4_9SPHI|nr:hybrid sensor histidine kinase/response regulator transcription factor [Pedobacter africanus]SMC67695.1 Signal transduction histidine kinase [Pedobacter africanus]
MKFARWKIFVFCLSIFAAGTAAMAQLPISFGNLTIENGLSQNSVIAIAQDRAGFLWFGTRQGLNRYDGYQFKIYRNSSSNPNSISGNEAQALLTDAAGQLWVGTPYGLNRYDQEKDAFINITKKNGLSANYIESIYEDADSNLWVGTINGLNLLTDKRKNRFRTFLFNPNKSDAVNRISCIFRDKDKNIWVGTGRGLVCMTFKNGTYTYKVFRHKNGDASSLNSDYVTAIAADQQQNLWIGTDNGIALFNPSGKNFRTFRHNNLDPGSLIHNDVREIRQDDKELLWIGTQEGLSILDPETMKFNNYQHEPEVKGSLSHNSIHSIFQDNAKTMWVGTYFGGVNFAYPIATRFTIYQNSKLRPSISGNVISSIVEDKNGSLWIATEGAGLNYADLKHNVYRNYKTNPDNPNSITSNLIKIMCADRSGNGDLIIGTHYGGLNIFSPATGKFRHIVNVKNDKNVPGTAEIIALLHDSRGTLWVGSMNGLSVLRKKNGFFDWRTSKSPLDKFVHKGRYGVTALFEDREKNLWMGTTAGLYRYNFNTKQLHSFLKNETDSTRLYSDFINCISQSKAGKILIGTYFGGFSIYDPATNHFKSYEEKDGLANDNVLGIIEDDKENLWISTANGLSEFNAGIKKFRNYTKSDGLAGNEFNARSYFKSSRGEIFFGGLNGLSSFYPSNIQTNTFTAPVVFTGLKLFNQPVVVNGPDQLLKEHMMLTRQLIFKHDQNHFTIGFALLNYIKSDKNKYAYKLEGYDKGWNYAETPSATYTNLPSGKYQFKVRGINNDGIPGINLASTIIRIMPPIWASWWAYLIYIFIFSIILFLIVRYLFIRALLKRSEDVQKMKLNFFTYVSHEIRTPLTLILGPLETLSKTTKDNPEINNQILPIRNNAERLMRLITELMDFRKAETGHLKLSVANGDIIGFIKEIFQSFQHLATVHQIQYSFNCEQEEIELYFDWAQLEKVLFNLLSNAFKFTSDKGRISVSASATAEQVIIKVRDNGKGIPYESQNKLFSDFFQVDEPGSSHIGSGIGLALSKSIVEAHGGSIAIESSPASNENPGDTCFTVTLKKGKAHFKASELTGTSEQAGSYQLYTGSLHQSAAVSEKGPKKTGAETILLVEDNPEIRQMLRGYLNTDYEVRESEDGLKGWQTATELLPDLIICDIMMPVMDGLKLCSKLKTDERTSHIPVILLTAKSTHVQQMDGLETGADSYVTKPFSIDLLKLNVRNLLQSRKTMRQKFSQQVTLQPQNVTISSVEHTFMTKMLQYIEDHMGDQDFNIPELAAHIGMSQPVLYKKIRAITDLSVNDFIKTIRLKKAAQLFVQKKYNVSEISYLVGFNDPKYFSREFRKQFGQSPKEYVNALPAAGSVD